MKECSKSIARRLATSDFINQYFVGTGLDIGGKPDPLAIYQELFCQMGAVKTWDWEDGDAQYLEGVDDGEYDFVHSSHCLEHMRDPHEALGNWFRAVKPGGHLIITIPDEDLYEQGVFPSNFNLDHKWTFTISKKTSWSDKSINVLEMIQGLEGHYDVQRILLLSSTYRYNLPRYDQTLSPVAECGIEFVLRKRPGQEIADKGRWLRSSEQPSKEMRLHLNQHRDDLSTLKNSNGSRPPFENDDNL